MKNEIHGKTQTTTINIFSFTFLYKEYYVLIENICLKNEKPKLIHYISITVFFALQLVSNAVIKNQRPYRFALVLYALSFNSKHLIID